MPDFPTVSVKNILLTGGSGNVGRRLRAELAGRFDKVRIFDRVTPDSLLPGEEAVTGDLADMAAVERAMRGVDGVIHLAAQICEADFELILQSNIVGTWNIYEAARRAGVKRVVFGSSNHVMGFYPRSQRVDDAALPRPDTRYALSKVFGESTGSLYADKYGVKSLHIRIGNAAERPQHARSLAIWISARDLAQLCCIGLTHPDIHNQIVYGVSNNAASFYANASAYRLGYKPQDSADDFFADAMEAEKLEAASPVAAYYQGAHFCAIEYAGGGVPEGDLPT